MCNEGESEEIEEIEEIELDEEWDDNAGWNS